MTLMWFFFSHFFVVLAVYLVSLLYWKTHQQPIFSVLAEGKGFKYSTSKISQYHVRPLAPQCGEVILYPWQKNSPKA